MLKNISAEKIKKSGAIIALFIVSLSLYFSFGFHHIAKFETADEHYWIYDATAGRIHDYWDAIAKKDWSRTRINDKPGVMLAYISGIGIFFEDGLQKRVTTPGNYESAFSSAETEKINFAFRAPLLIFNGLFALFLFWAIKRLTENKWLAMTAVILILLNPIIIGVSQIINPDSLLWIFSFSSLVSFLNYLKYRKRSDVILCSLLLGFALLSKYSAVIFIPFFFVVMLVYLLQEKQQFEFAQKAKRNALAYLLILLGAFAVFALLMPAVILSPSYFYYGTIGFKGMAPIFWSIIALDFLIFFDARYLMSKHTFYLAKRIEKIFPHIMKIVLVLVAIMFCLVLANWSIGDNFLGIKGLNFDAGHDYSFRRQDFFDKLFLEIYPLVFSLTPLVLVALIALWIKGVFGKLKYPLLVFVLSSFVIVFYAAVLKQDLLVNIRYSVMLYPLLMLLAALSIDEFILGKMKSFHKFILLLLVIGISSISLWLIKPYYFNYANDLLPKDSIVTGAWGYGGYEAAQFLNALPNSKNLKVWSDYWGVCSFFNGICVQASGYTNYMGKSEENTIDYYVMTRRGEMTNTKTWNRLKEDLAGKPVWELNIDDRPDNFIRIYRAEKD
ncbi:MAG: glycosyltransferase family 39 protein [Candidatus Moranbacteria bacterium]|nr:glycosyltransferase family 39 protein [Candidatus Moranbacteria bacterium]